MLFEEFQDGSHLGHQNKTILAILNLCRSNASHQVLAQSDLLFGRCRLKNFKMAEAAIFDIRMELFNNSESLCRSDASIKLWIWFGRRCRLKN